MNVVAQKLLHSLEDEENGDFTTGYNSFRKNVTYGAAIQGVLTFNL